MNKLIDKTIMFYKTPFYIFDITKVNQNINALRQNFGSKISICYAMKANPFIIPYICNNIDYIEACSVGELKICKKYDVKENKIVFSGVYKSLDDINYAMDTYQDNIIYTAESLSQYNMLKNCAIERNISIKTLIRLTSGNQFGMCIHDILNIIKTNNVNNIKIEGIHFYSGTQKKSEKKINEELSLLKQLINQIEKDYKFKINKLEYGPGLPVDYFSNNDKDDCFVKIVKDNIDAMHFDNKIVIELGRKIAYDCGNYVTQVVDIKNNNDKNYCIVDGGIHHVNYYGQMMAMKMPPVSVYPSRQGNFQNITVCGSLCTVSDVLVKDMPISDIRIGDVLIFDKVGAYSITESMALFLSHDLPLILVSQDGNNATKIRDVINTYDINSQNSEIKEKI